MIEFNVAPATTKRATWWSTLRMLWPYQRRYWLPFSFGVLLMGATLLFEIGIGVVQQYFFADMSSHRIAALLTLTRDSAAVGLGLVILSAVQHFCRYFASSYAGRALNADTLQKVHHFPFAWLQRFHSADLVSRLTNDTGLANNLLSSLVYDVLYQIVMGAVALWYLLRINAVAALVAILVGPALFALGRFFDGRVRRISERIQEQDSDIRARVQEAMQEMTAIRAYGLETRTASDYSAARTGQNRLKLRRAWMQSSMWQLVNLVQGCAQIVSAVLVAQRALHGTISPGQVMTFVFLMGNVQQPFMRMSQVWSDIQKALGAGDRLHCLDAVPLESGPGARSLDAVPLASHAGERSPIVSGGVTAAGGAAVDGQGPVAAAGSPDPGAQAVAVGDHAIEIRDVTFTPGREPGMAHWTDPSVLHDTDAPSEPLFRDLRLTVRTHETVALVGASGAGKTSVARLMCGLYRPLSGDVLIGGVSMLAEPERARRLLTTVPQNPHLFSGTIRENIAFGMDDATDEAVEAAARRAQIHDFAVGLEHGYETVVGEQGYKLSGGQRQRIAIARALLRDTPVLILDEPTSALDSETERAVQVSLDDLAHKKTLVIIAHRLSTIRRADRIIVFERGAVVEDGTHSELMRQGGAYARLIALQTG